MRKALENGPGAVRRGVVCRPASVVAENRIGAPVRPHAFGWAPSWRRVSFA